MSGVKHTPGPWEERFGDVYSPSGQVIPHWGDSWESPGRFVSESERDANARLIAAAPCMFEALEEFSREYDGFEDGNGDPCPVLAKARAAIARARGEQDGGGE